MATETLIKKIEKIEQELVQFQQPKSVLGKLRVDEKLLKKAKSMLFDFDIEKFITPKDLKLWKK